MSLADLGSSLSGLSMDPMFNMGIGLMSASGPSLMPHSLGQGLAAGAQFSQDATMKAAQAAMMRAQFQRYAWQNALLQRAIAGSGSDQSNPNYSPSLAGTATQRATDAASSDPSSQQAAYGSQGFTNGISATPTQIASQQFPQVSQGGAQALGMGSPTGAPSAPQGGSVLQQIMRTPTGMAAFAMNPSSTLDFAMARQFPMPTSDIINLQQAGALPAGSPERQALLGKYAVKTRNGAFIPGMGNYYSPNMPDGTVLRDPFNPSAGVILPQGMTQAQAAMSAAKAYPEEAAKARYAYPIALGQDTAHAQTTPATVIGPDGKPQFVSQAAAIGAGASGRPMQAGYTPEQEAQGQTFGEQNAKQFQGTQDAAQAAQVTSLGYQQAMADAKTFSTGRFADVKGKALAVLDGLGIHLNQDDQAKLGSYQDMSKILTTSAMQTARQMGSREAAQIVNSIVKTASPNASLSPEGFAQVVSFMQAPAYSKQAEAQAMQAWKNTGKDLEDFKSAWMRADVPAQILYSRLTPDQQRDFKEANPEAVKQLRDGYNATYHYGWTPLVHNYIGGGQ